jgi:hypothetical protein
MAKIQILDSMCELSDLRTRCWNNFWMKKYPTLIELWSRLEALLVGARGRYFYSSLFLLSANAFDDSDRILTLN